MEVGRAYPAKKVSDTIDAAFKGFKTTRRSSGEVLADKLGDWFHKHAEDLTGEQKDAVALVRHVLQSHHRKGEDA